jgi:hypothetical protein
MRDEGYHVFGSHGASACCFTVPRARKVNPGPGGGRGGGSPPFPGSEPAHGQPQQPNGHHILASGRLPPNPVGRAGIEGWRSQSRSDTNEEDPLDGPSWLELVRLVVGEAIDDTAVGHRPERSTP